MMLFKLSLKNIRKSFKDYAIYFMTLILGVAIFYVFNALDSQEAMIAVSASTREIMQLMITMVSGVSVCVALILGFLIIYANNFLIRRRKKEFGIYMTLGMGKREISAILLGETIMIGILSLGVGLVAGVFASQFMSILVADMFEADMTKFVFRVSPDAVIKTLIYFGIMYLIVVGFNTLAISGYKLIDLLQAAKKTEKAKMKNPVLAVLLFLTAVCMLTYAYYQVSARTRLLNKEDVLFMIFLGCAGTFLIFWSLSGFLLNLLKRSKRVYYYGLNSFVLRQFNSNINTAVFSMTVICLLFFVTICVLSSGLAMNNAFKKDLRNNTPVDSVLYKDIEAAEEKRVLTIKETLAGKGFLLQLFTEDSAEITQYYSPDITYKTALGDLSSLQEERLPLMNWDASMEIFGISDYNRIARLYGQPEYELEEDCFIMLCNYEGLIEIRNQALKDKTELRLGNSVLKPQFETCRPGFIYMNIQNVNMGTILVPDSVIEKEAGNSLLKKESILAVNYEGTTKEEKHDTEEKLEAFISANEALGIRSISKIYLYESSIGLSAVATFIAMYLGIVFLIAGAAIVALKELSESTDNRGRFTILDKIGADVKMQHKALLAQMGMFFGLPMLLAVIHSVFGIQYARNLLSIYGGKDMAVSIVFTALILIVIYGAYFLATYYGGRRIIETKQRGFNL